MWVPRVRLQRQRDLPRRAPRDQARARLRRRRELGVPGCEYSEYPGCEYTESPDCEYSEYPGCKYFAANDVV